MPVSELGKASNQGILEGGNLLQESVMRLYVRLYTMSIGMVYETFSLLLQTGGRVIARLHQRWPQLTRTSYFRISRANQAVR